jgi:multimeric flavodoxin WrbA
MKKIVIISASPRKEGNSDILCDKFVEGATDAGHQTEKIFLRDKDINYCMGCGYCNISGFNGCAKNDDMDSILDKMIEADVIVFATPIYFCTIAGQLKTFIDRIYAKYTKIKNKEFYYIMTAGKDDYETIQHALGEFKGLLSYLANSQEKGYVFAGGVTQKGDIKDTEYMQQAYNMGKNV